MTEAGTPRYDLFVSYAQADRAWVEAILMRGGLEVAACTEAELVKSIEAVAGHMAAIMGELKLDLDDPNYEQTPERVAKMYLEMFHGLREGAEPIYIVTGPPQAGE